MVIGEIAGVVLGRAVRGSIRSGPVRVIDSFIGVAPNWSSSSSPHGCWAARSPSSNQQNLAAAARLEGDHRGRQVRPDWPLGPQTMSALLSTSGLPEVLEPDPHPIQAVDPPDPSWPTVWWCPSRGPASSRSAAWLTGCQKVLEGTGSSIAPNRVMSNAHVVAGSDSVTVEAEGEEIATPRWCPTTPTPTSPSSMSPTFRCSHWSSPTNRPKTGTDAVVLGYPGAAISWRLSAGCGRSSN